MAEITEEIKTELSEALRKGKADEAEALTKKALEEGMDPFDLIQEVIVPTLTLVGQDFQDFKIFLPELMKAGAAAKRASAPIEEAIAASGKSSASLGTVVIGTVESDVHDIGKNIVATLLNAHGFKVIDLGRDVSPTSFLENAQKEGADIIAMSSLMTTTRPAQSSTLKLFDEVGERQKYKMIVGGGCVTQEWSDEIGADGYAEDAAGAVDLCKKLLQKT
jgi:corrinoid protein of di/trimethylamine methyltransferase